MDYKKDMKMRQKGYAQGDMNSYVEEIQKPEKCYAERFKQKPDKYIERQDKRQASEAKKLGAENYMGKYN